MKFETWASIKNHIIGALENLASYLVAHHSAKVVVLVDEYDSACSDAIVYATDAEKKKAEKVIDQTIDLCVGAISCLAKSNDNVDRAILTGISYLPCLGKLNNVIAFRFQDDHDFSGFYGLTSDELERLLFDQFSQHSAVMDHYNGYRNGIVSLWSVGNFLNQKRIDNYWKSSGMALNLFPLFKIETVSSFMCKMLSGIYNRSKLCS